MDSTGTVQTCPYMNTHTHTNLGVVNDVRTVHKAIGLNEISKGFREEIQVWSLGHSAQKDLQTEHMVTQC